MQKNILSYIWRYSKSQQLFVVALTLLSFPILYLTLELPKWIINDALTDKSATKTLFGFEFAAVPFLVVLCVSLLVLIVMNGVLKMRINTYKGIIGERLVRRLRFSLIDRLLRFPLSHFSRVSSGEMISTVTAETEPLAGYIGESIALPLFQGGTMITILVFMFAQDWVFGLVSVALIPVQGYLIPKLQKQVNALKKERVRRVRKLSERIGETVAGAEEIRLQGTEAFTLAEFSRRFGDLFWVRLEIFRKKFFMKFLNNTIGQITPFLFYLFGGYLVLKGDLTIGALVAALGAYKDLTSPWKELLNHYQNHEDAKIKYGQIVELFNPDGMVDSPNEQAPGKWPHLDGSVKVDRLSWVNDHGERVLSGVNLDIPAGSSVAIIGDFGVRRARLARLLVALDKPSSGTVSIGGESIDSIPNAVLRTRVGFQGPSPHLFSGTIADNVRYGLNQKPPTPGPDDADESRQGLVEAEASGNSPHIQEGLWHDLSLVDIEDKEDDLRWYMDVSRATGALPVIYRRSLLEIFDPKDHPELAQSLLACRRLLSQRIIAEDLGDLVEIFDPDVFNHNASVAENILFGLAADDRLDNQRLASSPYLHKVLQDLGLYRAGVETGLAVGRRLLDLSNDLPAGSTVLEQFDLTDEDRVEALTAITEAWTRGQNISQPDEHVLLALFLRVIPNEHSFAGLDHRTMTQILQARRDFAQGLPTSLAGAVIAFDADRYHGSLTVHDNILFGRVNTSEPAALRLLDKQLSDVLDEMQVRNRLAQLLGESQVGISGARLPVDAKHRLPLGRVLAKKPDVIVFHDALAPFDAEDQRGVRDRIRELLPNVTLIWINRDIDDPTEFDQIYEFTEAGPLQQRGFVAEADAPVFEEPAVQQMSDPYGLISHATLFSPLKPNQHRFLAEHSKVVKVPANTWVYHSDDDADAAWLIMSGTASSYRPDQQDPVGELGRLEVFGALELLAGRPRILGVRTASDMVLLRIDGDAIDDLANGDAQVSRALLRALTNQWTSGRSSTSQREA